MNKEQQIKEWFNENTEAITMATFSLKQEKISSRENYTIFLHLINGLSENVVDAHLMRFICMATLVYEDIYFERVYGNSLFLLKDTLIKKNKDYGNSFDRSIDKFGWLYLAMELDKKKNRIKSLLKNKDKPNFENIEDTLLDIAGYCVLGLIYLENVEKKSELTKLKKGY